MHFVLAFHVSFGIALFQSDVNAGKDNDVGPEQRKMMLESFVLQLLCVRKKV